MKWSGTAMASDPRDYKLDLSGSGDVTPANTPAPRASANARPFLSVHFACCGAYQRVYRDAAGRHYEGRCPRCRRAVRFAVGEGGTAARYFVAR